MLHAAVGCALFFGYPNLLRSPLSLLRRFGSIDPGLHDIAIVPHPLPGTHERVARYIDNILELVELLFVEPYRSYERVGHGVLVPEILVHNRTYCGWIVQLFQGVLRISKVFELVPLVHPVWRPGDKHEFFLTVVTLLDLGEHAWRARLHELLLEAVRRDDVLGDLLHNYRAGLDT